MELLAVFDEQGNPTGERVERERAHREGILHGGSHIFIYRVADGRVQLLLQRRSSQKDSFPDCLDISSAGHVEAGMGFEDTAIKELNEELGISVLPGELSEVFFQRYSAVDAFRGEIFHNEEVNRVYVLQTDPDIASLTLQPEEVSEVLWMDAEEIASRTAQGDSEICIDPDELKKVLEAIENRLRNEAAK